MRERRFLPAAVVNELAVKNATNTPWWWGLFVLIKVRAGEFGGVCGQGGGGRCRAASAMFLVWRGVGLHQRLV